MPKPRFHGKPGGGGKTWHRPSKRPRKDGAGGDAAGAAPRRARDAVSPWQDVPYEEQLRRKHELLAGPLKGLVERFKVTLEPVVASPLTQHYRNKIDLTIGFDQARQPAVGFRVNGFLSEDGAAVEGPDDCLGTVPPLGVSVASRASAFIKSSTLPPYDLHTHKGFWRALTIRHSEAHKQLMLCIRAAPNESDVDFGKAEMSRFVEDMSREPFGDQRVTSVFVQWYDGISAAPPPEMESTHVSGTTSITEKLLGMDFLVSPGAFFQANTPCAGVLFDLVQSKIANLNLPVQSSAVLDVCCGTGVIGLLLARAFSLVVGVDLNGAGISDARQNALANNVRHAHYIHAKAEDVMQRLLGVPDGKTRPVLSPVDEAELVAAKAKADLCTNFVAVVDPPRAGLHKSVIRALRETEKLRTIVYVSCNPTGSFVTDVQSLCEVPPCKWRGQPFVLKSLQPVDMFPNTEHCEMVAVLEREPQQPQSTASGAPAASAAAVAGGDAPSPKFSEE